MLSYSSEGQKPTTVQVLETLGENLLPGVFQLLEAPALPAHRLSSPSRPALQPPEVWLSVTSAPILTFLWLRPSAALL